MLRHKCRTLISDNVNSKKSVKFCAVVHLGVIHFQINLEKETPVLGFVNNAQKFETNVKISIMQIEYAKL